MIIEDLNKGNMSVTNCIEDIIDDINKAEGTCRRIAIYKDSEGIWDGFDRDTMKFVPLRADSFTVAVDRFNSLDLNIVL